MIKLKVSVTIDGPALYAGLVTLCSTGVAGYITYSRNLPETVTLPVMATTVVPSVISWIAAKRMVR